MADNEGVTPESPTGTDASGTPDQAGNPVAPGGSRSLENVYGEFNRKYSQLAERFESLQSGIEAISKKLGAPPAAPQPQVAVPGPVSPFGCMFMEPDVLPCFMPPCIMPPCIMPPCIMPPCSPGPMPPCLWSLGPCCIWA